MEKFRAYRLSEVDKKIKAEFVECTLDDLDPGELVVRVAYSDVNYKDALAATGKGRILLRPVCIGGIDLAGTVVSSSDAAFAKGDAVLAVGHELGVKHHGGYAEYARIPAAWAVKPAMRCWLRTSPRGPPSTAKGPGRAVRSFNNSAAQAPPEKSSVVTASTYPPPSPAGGRSLRHSASFRASAAACTAARHSQTTG